MTAHPTITALARCLLAFGLLANPAGELLGQEEIPNHSLLAVARSVMDAVRYCALVTVDESGTPRVRTMDAFAPEADMTVWLGTNRHTRKVAQIRAHPQVALYYQAPDGSGYVTINGRARLVDDEREKAARWKPEWEAFYPDRAGDYLLIEVVPERVEVVDYSRGVVSTSESWEPPSVVLP